MTFKNCLSSFVLFASIIVLNAGLYAGEKNDDGFESIFDGKTLKNWDGNPKLWSVEDGAITGTTTDEDPIPANTFLIWKGGETADFELKCEYKIVNGNSGIQYRSFPLEDKWAVGGYQADFEAGDKYSGILYGEKFRGILALRGEKTVIGEDHKPKVVGSVGDTEKIQANIKKEDWNSYHIIAKGNHFIHKINGMVTVEVTDDDVEKRRASGLLALQVHKGPAMKVQFRNMRIKHLKKKVDKQSATSSKKKKVALIAGPPSHGYGAHEHKAGCMLLAKAIDESELPVETVVYSNGWPKDHTVLNNVDAIVIYCDGQRRHIALDHIPQLEMLMKKGTGIGMIHYAVHVEKGKPGDHFIKWTGGFFENNWSVNPHWTPEFKSFPDHPVTNGVNPFSLNDEWYYHMRFGTDMAGVTPILSDVPPESSLNRPDGKTSGNPTVREAVAKKQTQHMCWVKQREDGGRGFGFTGGHVHWNWAHNDFRKLVLNSIVWITKADVPSQGVPSKELCIKDLEENQDYPKPENFDVDNVKKMILEWN